MADIFLSYSREDQATARRFAEALQREGFDVWWDVTLQPGEVYDKVTERALEQAQAVVVLWSKTSVESRWVRSEATTADRLGTLLPVMIEACKRPIQFELMHTADLSQWRGDPQDPVWRSLVSTARRLAGAARPDQPPPVAPPPATPQPRRPGPRIAAAALAVALLAAALLYWKPWRAAQTRDVTAPSIAVLPFENLSADKEQEFFSDGLAEELLNHLAQIPNLRVIGRTSSFAFKGRDEDLRRIGELLGVNHILEGSVRKAGNRVRIAAQLINPMDGTQLWSATYERTLDDIFAIQDEIARTVAEQLQVKMGVQSLDAGGTRNVTAFQEFLAGRALMNSIDVTSVQLALPHLEHAVELDPAYVTARLWLVEAYARTVGASSEPAAQTYHRQDAVIDQIAGVAPSTPEASLAMSYRAARGRDLAGQERLLKGALPVPGASGTQARLRYARFLSGVGQMSAARTEVEQVLKNEPLDIFAHVLLYEILEASGDLDNATNELVKLRQLPGGNTIETMGGWVVMAQSRHDVVALRKAITDLVAAGGGQPFLRDLLGIRMEDFVQARKIIEHQIATIGFPGNAGRTIRITEWAEFFGDRELALRSIQYIRHQDYYFESIAENLWRPVLAGMRKEPAFKQILRDLGIVDYWRATGNWGDFCKPAGTTDFECR